MTENVFTHLYSLAARVSEGNAQAKITWASCFVVSQIASLALAKI